MPDQLIKMSSEFGEIYVETEEPEDFNERVVRSLDGTTTVSRTESRFDQVVDTIHRIAYNIQKALDDASPDEMTLEMGIKIGGEAGAFIAKAKTDAHITVRMVWRKAR